MLLLCILVAGINITFTVKSPAQQVLHLSQSIWSLWMMQEQWYTGRDKGCFGMLVVPMIQQNRYFGEVGQPAATLSSHTEPAKALHMHLHVKVEGEMVIKYSHLQGLIH
jgi:hypothetical protein